MRALVLAFFLCVLPLFSQDKIDPGVEKLQKQFDDPSGDREKLRQEVLAFMRGHVGSDACVQAAALLTKLPSPLDKLDSKLIPELDRFAWQPKELVAVLGEHRGRHGSPATCVVWTRDGKRVISGGTNSLVRLWDAATMKQEAITSTGYYTTCLAVSRDNKTLAAGTAHGQLHVWDISGKDPKETGRFAIGTSHVYDVDISGDGKMLAAGVLDGLVHTFDLDGSKPKERTQQSGHKAAARAVRFSADSRYLAAAAADGTIRFWSFTGGEKINDLGSLPVHTAAISSLAFAPRGGYLMAGCDDGHVVRVNMGAKFTKGTFFKTPSYVTAVEFSLSGILTTSHQDGAVRLWGVTTVAMPKPTTQLEGHYSHVAGFAYSPDGKIVTAGQDWTIRQWTLTGRPAERFPLKGHWSRVYQNPFSPDGTTLATGSEDRTVRLWNLTKSTPTQAGQFSKENTSLYTVAWSPDGKSLATGGNSTTARLWDLVKRTELRTFPNHPTHISNLFFAPEGQRLLAASGKTVVMWNATTGREAFRFDGHQERVNSMTMSPDGKYLLTGTGYYRYEGGKIVTIKGVYQYDDCSIRMWDLREGRLRKDVTNLEKPISNLTYTPDGKTFACSLWELPATLWEGSLTEIKKKGEIKNSSHWSHLIAFTPDGKRMATIGRDGKLRLTDVASDKAIKEWTFNESIAHFTFSPDSRYLAVSIVQGPVYILKLDGDS